MVAGVTASSASDTITSLDATKNNNILALIGIGLLVAVAAFGVWLWRKKRHVLAGNKTEATKSPAHPNETVSEATIETTIDEDTDSNK